MARRTIITVVVLLAILGLIYWFQSSRDNDDVSGKTDLSVSAFNRSKNADAVTVSASPRDELVYTLTVHNTSDDVVPGYVVETNIGDVSELATLIDAQGANYNASNNSLMWTPLDIPANGSIEKQFTVRVKDSLPSDSDLVMKTAFNNELAISVIAQATGNNSPTPAQTPAQPPFQAPTTGPSAWFAFLLALVFTVGILLYRAARRIQA